MSSSVLYKNADKTIILLDIPRSIELAQASSENLFLRRLISCKPIEQPFPSVEPKSGKAKAKLGETSIKSLLLERHIQLSFNEVKKQHEGPWCLPRIVHLGVEGGDERPPMKKQKSSSPVSRREYVTERSDETSSGPDSDDITIIPTTEVPKFYQNDGPKTIMLRCMTEDTSQTESVFVPPYATLVNRFIQNTDSFLLPNDTKFPQFDLILLDPPWPNRSVKRKNNYSTSTSIQALLTTIPIPYLVAPGGIVGLWITNRPAFHALILDPGGIFDQWGIELIEEWVWVKITNDGDPISELDGFWRKPYEILLVGRKREAGETREQGTNITRRVMFAVPDIHSRKPNLKGFFEETRLLQDSAKYEALEVFARNLTSGWWGLGDEVVRFQGAEAWV